MARKSKRGIMPVLLFLIVFIGTLAYIFPFKQVKEKSMEPTIPTGVFVLNDKLSYLIGEPQRGDVVMYYPPNSPDSLLIARIVAKQNDKLKIQFGEVFINGERLQEPYLAKGVSTQLKSSDLLTTGKEFVVPSGNYFIMGDNRPKSNDSRSFGFVPKQLINSRYVIVLKK